MSVDKEMVSRIANLARLEIAEHEAEALLKDMNNILGFMEKLDAVDTDGTAPLIYLTDEVNCYREDEIKKEFSVHEALQNAPLHDGHYFKVPKVISK